MALDMLFASFPEGDSALFAMGFNVPDSSLHTLRYHSEIYEQVRAGDAEGARNAIREHLIENRG